MQTHQDPRNLIKLRHFKLIETLMATRSIRLAAERLRITPAAVSKSCLELENILNTKLFIRKSGELIPYPLCERLVATGRRISAELNNLINEIPHHDKNFHNTVKIGFQTPMLQDAIVRGVAKIKHMHPNLNLILEYGSRQSLLSGIETNLYDFIFISLTDIIPHPRFKAQKLGEEQYVIANIEEIYSIPDVLQKWEEFSSATWVLPVKGLAIRDKFDSILAARRLSLPERRIEINSPIGREKIISLSNAFTIAPLTVMRELGRLSGFLNETLSFLPEMCMDTGIVWLKDSPMSSAAQYVSEFIINKIVKSNGEIKNEKNIQY